MELVLKRCKHCGSDKANLYYEDGYHDIQCPECGCRSGIRGDENEVIALWNGEVYQPTLYAVIWHSNTYGRILEIHEDEKTAKANADEFNRVIVEDKKSILGGKVIPSLGIREYVSVMSLQLNKTYKIREPIDG
jgi:hypothetical protein